MNVILPNCRAHLTREDIEFVSSILAANEHESRFISDLLVHSKERDVILDNHRLFDALQDRPECLRISCHLYFYLVVRDALRKANVDDVVVADYVAEVLAEFSDQRKALPKLPGKELSSEYLADMMIALQSMRDRDAFALRAHVGDFALFMAGLYPQRIEYRERLRGAPGMDYFEAVGQQSYRVASHLRQANDLDISGLLDRLSGCFHTVRMALNRIRERLISDNMPPSIAALIQ